MKFIDVQWYSGVMGTVGIVAIESEVTGERKFYIGVGDGYSEQSDIQRIMTNGMPVYPEALIEFLNQHKPTT